MSTPEGNNSNNPNPAAPNPDPEKKDKGEPVDTTTMFDALPEGHWKKYYQSLNDRYTQSMVAIAKNDAYDIQFIWIDEKTGEEKLSTKNYRRRKINVGQYNELERLRGEFAKVRFGDDANIKLAQVYEKCALYYLGIPYDDYVKVDWESTKLILDACAFRTMYGLPYSPKASNSS